MQNWAQPALLVLAAAVPVAVAVWLVHRLRQDPNEKERRRRLMVNRDGRLGDAMITEVQDDLAYYSYTIRGVGYTASQDLSQLKSVLPGDLERIIGPVTVKYTPRNPANSIILSETWSGLRKTVRA